MISLKHNVELMLMAMMLGVYELSLFPYTFVVVSVGDSIASVVIIIGTPHNRLL